MRTPHRWTGLKSLLATAFALVFAACGDSGPTALDGGRVQFVLSSAPDVALAAAEGVAAEGSSLGGEYDDDRWHHERIASANVTFTSVLARNYDGVLLNIDMELPATVDVVKMEEGREVTLPDGDLPPGTYDQVVVVMSAVQLITRDSTTITIDPPGGGWTAIIPVCPFVVEEGATTVVGLKMSIRRSFLWEGQRFFFKPHFECDGDDDEER